MNMSVRGAPAIGVAASFGVYLSSLESKRNVNEYVKKAIRELALTRPTARNLFWALEKMEKVLNKSVNRGEGVGILRRRLLAEAKKIYEFEKRTSFLIGKYGNKLIEKKDKILTVCNAGALATVGWGTALSIVYQAHNLRKNIKVFACETRPRLQGARLTCWELIKEGINVTLITDFAAGRLIQENRIDKIITGADRILRNGDVANKIGTYTLAVLAKRHRIPFYVAAPFSTFDFNLRSWQDIPIEERDKKEVLYINKIPIAPLEVEVYNPAFDCVPHSLISAIITERGIIYPPFHIK